MRNAMNIHDRNQLAGKVHRDFGLPPGPYGLGYAPACGPARDGHISAYAPTDAPVTCGVCLRMIREGELGEPPSDDEYVIPW